MRRSRQSNDQIQRCKRRRPETQTPTGSAQEDPEDEAVAAISKDKGAEEKGSSFFGCYLLTSLSPRFKGHTYIGFTVNPKRRIRQHNGEITSGAFRTKRKRPWEMVVCIHGFPTQVAALQFEWAWQHPKESLAVREAASTFKSLGGLANKIKLGVTMLTLQSWQSMALTVSFFSTKYMMHTAGCPSLPHQMKIHFCSMDELPCYGGGDHPHGRDDENDDNSNHTEESDVLSDDRQVSSVDGVGDICRSFVDIERSDMQNVSEDIGTWDQRSLASPLWEESSTMIANVEEDEQLSQSLRADAHQQNNTKGRVRGSQEIPPQEHPESFSRIDSDKEFPSHPVLELEMELHCQSPAVNLRSIGTDRQIDFFPSLEDLTKPGDRADLSIGESSLTGTEIAKKDDMTIILIDESTEEKRHPRYDQLPITVNDDVQPSSMKGIEVIDLFTPSPEGRIISGSKKRSTAHDHPDIIDLTRSPLFVQL